ncbi:hypothetical protein B0H19DRAFT_1212561 [Mycena capillaripes]|nr:hypothetical protein B0H19DRAFT_1212561 [Mycena capillaripes]
MVSSKIVLAVKALLESGKPYHVLLGSRSLYKAKDAIETLQKEFPASANTSIERAFAQIQASHGHIHPRATFDIEYLAGKVSHRECFTKSYDVNLAGTHVLTYTFVPLLLKSTDPRLIFMTGLSNLTKASEEYFPTPPQPAGWPKKIAFETIGYRCSKVGLNMLMLDWNHKFKADGVKVWALGPGFLATSLGNIRDKLIRNVVEGERDADVGKIVGKDGLIPF